VESRAVELGENNRFRVAVEPLLTALIAFAATQAWRRARRGEPDAAHGL